MARLEDDDYLLRRTAVNLFSGLMGGVANCLTGHPFDTLKVRLQTQSIKSPIYSGVVDCFKKTVSSEGLGGLYKGVGSPLVGQMFNRGTSFASYYQASVLYESVYPERDKKSETIKYFFSGACAGFFGSFVEGPIDLFKTKMQVQVFESAGASGVSYRHVFHAGWVIASQHGITGVYQGLSATWLRNIPSFSLYFGSYELLKQFFRKPNEMDISMTKQLMSGAGAGLCYWIFTYPTDVIKSSMQSDHLDKSKRKYQSMYQCARTLYVDEGGWRRFYKGYIPCIMRTVPSSASMLLVMEKCRQWLGAK